MSNVLSEEKKQQIVGLGRVEWSLRRIERETGIHRETAARYLAEAGIPIRKPGRPNKQTAKPAISAAEVPPDSGRKKLASSSISEPFRDLIDEALARGRNAKGMRQDLVDDHGFTGSYQSVKRFVRRQAGPVSPEARAPAANCTRRPSARLGGVPKIMVLDNLGEGVRKADCFDPSINPLYRDMLAHYGACALPCRINEPDRKGSPLSCYLWGPPSALPEALLIFSRTSVPRPGPGCR